jgi:hypothetical protein
MRLQAIALVLALAVVAAGCGSKKSAAPSGGSATTTTTTASTTTATTTAAMTTTASTTTTAGGGGTTFASSKNCLQLKSIGEKFAKAISATSGTGKSSITDVASIYKALAQAAPSEIRPDFETIAAAFSTYADALRKSGYTPGKVPTAAQIAKLSALSKTFSDPKLAAAEQHLSAWGTKNCGGLTTTTG